ncbi:MAG: TolC family outer membrane protein [bacterium]
MIKRKVCVAVSAAIMCCTSAVLNAENLVEVFDLAKAKDPQIRAALAQRESTREARPIAMAGLLPNIGMSGNLQYRNQTFDDTAIDDEDFGSAGLSVDLLQPIYRRDRVLAVEQAEWQLEQADADYASAEQDLIFRTATAYFGVLAAQEDVEFAKAELTAIERQLDQAQQRFEVGLIAVTDVHEAQARFDQSRADLIRAENNLDNAWEELRTIIATKPDQLAQLQDEMPLTPPDPAEIDEWSDMALKNSPIVQASSHATQIAQREIDRQHAGHYPTLDLFAGYSTNRTGRNEVSDSDDAQIGVLLDVPLYQGGGVSAATRKARQDLMVSQENLDNTRRLVDREVRDSYRGVQASISGVRALEASTVSAQSALDATEAGFEVGTRTQIDVLNSQRDFFRAKRDYAQARYNYILLHLRLRQAAGILSIEDLKEFNKLLK